MLCKKMLSICLALIVLFSLSSNVVAESSELPIILKMNQFFVLYTEPEGPYLDKENRMMIPARIFCQKLIGANVDYSPKTKIISIDFDGNSLKMTLDNAEYTVNNNHAAMDTVPIIKSGRVFIPIRTLINAFNINTSWNQEYRYISLDDKRIMKSQMVKDMLDLVGGVGDNANAFIPINFKLNTTIVKDTCRWDLETTLKNVTGADIPEGKENVEIFMTVGDGISFSDRFGKRPAVKKDGFITKREIVEENTSNKDKLEFILLLGRTI